jgi:arylsulfatase A-like enzyme
VLLTLVTGWQEIRAQRYIQLDLWRSAAGRLAEGTLDGLILGLVFGLALLVFVAGARILSAELAQLRGRPLLSSLVKRCRAHPGPQALVGALALTVLALLSLQAPGLLRAWTLPIVLAVGLWILIFLLAKPDPDGPRDPSRTWDSAIISASALTAYFLALAWLRKPAYGRLLPRLADRDTLVALSLGLVLLWALLGRQASTSAVRRGARIGWGLLEALTLIPFLLMAASANLRSPIVVHRPLNVMIIGIDTLRFDVVAPDRSSGARQPTPFLQRWGQQAWRFRQAISQASWTMPAFASILTGKYPHQHGANALDGYLADRELTLAELLRDAGYHTGAVVSHYYVDQNHGFGQGFVTFDEELVVGPHAVLGKGVKRSRARVSGSQHGPALLPVPALLRPALRLPRSPPTRMGRLVPRLAAPPNDDRHLEDEAPSNLMGPDELRYLADVYAEEVRYTDRQIERVILGLRRLGLERNTLVVLAADHGEELGEHDWIGHSLTLREPVIHVPLLIDVPGRPSGSSTVDEPVETRRIFPTILDALDAEARFLASEAAAGSLLPLMAPDRAPSIAPAFTSVWLPTTRLRFGSRARLAAVRLGTWKLLRNVERGRDWLYDLANDPHERRDLSGLEPEHFELLSRQLDQWLAQMQSSAAPSSSRPLTAEEQARLKTLGYL